MPERGSKNYWRDWKEHEAGVEFSATDNELTESEGSRGFRPSRRDFLRAAGFTFAGAALTGCSRAPTGKAIPYLNQPEEIVPGRACFYSSTCAACPAGCGMIVKNRDGRPIKLEGNPAHPLSRGGLCAIGQASLLGLYDSHRLKNPMKDGREASWQEVDQTVAAKLEEIRPSGAAVRFLSGTITSPTLRKSIAGFLTGYRDARHITYDALSHSALLDAHERTHGTRLLPRFRFDRAEVVVGFDADFLGAWISPVEFSRSYQAGRTLEGRPPQFSYHVHFESRLSLTGSRADRRVRVSPGELGVALTYLAARIAKRSGTVFDATGLEEISVGADVLDELAERLWQARGRSLVLCGRQDLQAQILTNYVNRLLGNYGATLDIDRPSLQSQGDDRELERLLAEIRAGKVGGLFVYNANPVYDFPDSGTLKEALRRIPLTVSLSERLDETTFAMKIAVPDHDDLESWGDAEPVRGLVSIRQPAINALDNSRPVLETLARWIGSPKTSYEIIRDSWRSGVFPRQKRQTSFETFWEQVLQDGFVEVPVEEARAKNFDMSQVKPILKVARPEAGAFTLLFYSKVGIRDGRHAYNPWLQELPDPISKVTWDNYACLSPVSAARLGVADGDVVRLEGQAGGETRRLELPAFVQPGQDDTTVGVALGYGSRLTGRFSKIGPSWIDAFLSVGPNGLVGKNAAIFREVSAGLASDLNASVSVSKTGEHRELASTQRHYTMKVPHRFRSMVSERPPVVRETTLAALARNAGNPEPETGPASLWPQDHPYTGHRWGMAIDLSACTGCSACVVACQAENNIPVVGQDEVRRKREMHWIRVDRYYSARGDDVDVVQQPMLCQQCENAPCETVCPVLASVHSAEGLNMQVYNRCVGTRYCANNCPYKVRRFNWFEYHREDKLQNLALNPDVTVRSRGVMEKCTFCVQRIQEAKIEAKRRGVPLTDGDIQTACQETCPTGAIVFGDRNDPNSRVSKQLRTGRSYHVLEELNVRPSVSYLSLVRNRPEEKG
jgi:molybdopterin-containing oxidoreductase family iron-sulfur binding subunit